MVIWLALVLLGHVANVTASSASPPRIVLFVFQKYHCDDPEFFKGLAEFGYHNGRNIRVDCVHANGSGNNLLPAARQIVASQPALIVARGHYLAEAVMTRTRSIPVVAVASGDPVAVGWASSLARPGGNLTGLSYFQFELYAKRLEYLKAAVPNLQRVGLLIQPGLSKSLTDMYIAAATRASRPLGITLKIYEAKNRGDIDGAFQKMARDRIQGLHVLGYYLFGEEVQLVANLAEIHAMPVMHFMHEYPTAGGLMGFGPDYKALRRRMGYYVHRILRGSRPGDLPIEQPRDFVLSVNLEAARGLGLTMPASILTRADKVIE